MNNPPDAHGHLATFKPQRKCRVVFANPARRSNDTCAGTGTNSTLQCPLDYSSGVGDAFDPFNVLLSDAACSSETLDAANWKVEVCIVPLCWLC